MRDLLRPRKRVRLQQRIVFISAPHISSGGNGVLASNYKAEELAILEDQISVREKAVSVAEKNAAAIQSVSMNVKQAQAKSMRQNMGRRQPQIFADERANSAANEYLNAVHNAAEPEQTDEADGLLPPLGPSARSNVVAEKALDDKRKATSVSVSLPFAGTGSPIINSQQHNSQKSNSGFIFNIESARNIVSAVIQLGFTLEDQETFAAVLVEKVRQRCLHCTSDPSLPPHVTARQCIQVSLTTFLIRSVLS